MKFNKNSRASYFYTQKDGQARIGLTLFALDKDGLVYCGMALSNWEDLHVASRKVGRSIAEGRARAAMEGKTSSTPHLQAVFSASDYQDLIRQARAIEDGTVGLNRSSEKPAMVPPIDRKDACWFLIDSFFRKNLDDQLSAE